MDDYLRMGGGKAGIGLQRVNGIMCSLEGGHTPEGYSCWHVTGVLT